MKEEDVVLVVLDAGGNGAEVTGRGMQGEESNVVHRPVVVCEILPFERL